jgi:hypothetical protein
MRRMLLLLVVVLVMAAMMVAAAAPAFAKPLLHGCGLFSSAFFNSGGNCFHIG